MDLIQSNSCPHKRKRLGPRNAQRDDRMSTQEKVAIYMLRREASEGTHPAHTLIFDFQPPDV